MSVVAVKITDNGITMAADSIVVHGEADKTPIGQGKIHEVNGMLFGHAGLASTCNLFALFCETHTPIGNSERDILAFMLEFNQWEKSQDIITSENSQFLLAYDGKVFYINGNYIAEVKDYFAIGYAADYATAALYLGHSPYDAVKTACHLCCYVAEPIIVKTMPR